MTSDRSWFRLYVEVRRRRIHAVTPNFKLAFLFSSFFTTLVYKPNPMKSPGVDITQEKFVVELLKQGNENAFDALFRDYAPKIYNFSYRYLKSREEAEEVVQETFMRVWEARQCIDTDYSFSGFLFTIAYRLVLNRLRKIRNDQKGRKEWKGSSHHSGNQTEETVNYNNLNEIVHSAISELPPRRKMIFQLVKEENLTYQQTAEKLRISVKTVEAQMTEALRYLRKKLISGVIAATFLLC